MEQNSLYYFFSTVAQVLAAIAALLAIFTQFKITDITAYLIGDGEATLKRMEKKEAGYIMPSADDEKKYLDRLRDAISRKSILGILEVIRILSAHEVQQGKHETRSRGLYFLKIRFENKKTQISNLKSLTKKSIAIAFIAIFISLVLLVFVQYLKDYCFVAWCIIGIILILAITSMIFTFQGVTAVLEDTDEV